MNDTPASGDAPQRTQELQALYARDRLGFAYVDTNLRLLRANPTFIQLAGVATLASLNDGAPAIARLAERALAGTAQSMEIPPSAQMPAASIDAHPLYHDDGRVCGLSILSIQQSGQLLGATTGSQEQSTLRRVADTLPTMLLVFDDKLRLQFANRAWSIFTGAGGSPTITPIQSLLHEDDLEAFEQLVPSAIRRRARRSCEARLRDQENCFRWHLLEARPTGDEFTDTWEVLVICTNIEAQKRTAELLRSKTSRLLEEDERKNHFLAVLGHEIRNPLAAMANAVTSLANDIDRDWALAVLREQMDMLGMLVDDLLDDARIREGKIQLRADNVELDTILHLALESLRATAATAQVETRLELPDAPVHVRGDRTRLQQIFANLIRNAVKFSSAKQLVTVHVEVRPQTDDVLVSVADKGKGIPKRMLRRIFDPFVQVDGDRRYPDQGLGVGLSLVRQLAELHGGEVSVRSDGPGTGATFVVTLPLADSGRSTNSRSSHRRKALKPQQPTGARTVLLVDDNEMARVGLGKILRSLGLEVTEASTATDGLREAMRMRPDVAILDIGLPDFSGYQLARDIRQDLSSAPPTLIALSGYAPRDPQSSSDFDHHLLKPVQLDRLLSCMDVPEHPGNARGR